MLNWEEIANRIEKPILCTQNDVQDLKDFCEKFPYSQVFPLLYLKVLSQGNHVHFEEELEKYAFKITDRVQLYNLLHQEDIDISTSISAVESSNSYDDQNFKQESVVINEVEFENNPVSEIEEEIIEISSISNEEEQLQVEEIFEENEFDSKIDPLEKEILASSAAASFVLEELDQDNSELPEFDLSLSDGNEYLEKEDLSISNQNSNSEKTFMEWLSNSIHSNIIETIEEDEIPYEVSYIEFEKPKKEFFSPIKKAKESLSEETLPISETLAKIYHSQGNISKAIDVYHKLSLIIPEKKSYFASQIKSLKKKIN